MTIYQALAEGSVALKQAAIESSTLDASLLLANALNTSRASLIAAGPDPLSKAALAAFRRLIKRRLAGECVAYILGRKEFHGLDFAVNPSVLVPRPDTETLVEAALEKCRNQPRPQAAGSPPARILDLCTGSGAVAIALKHECPELEVWATDISSAALETAKTNAARLIGGRLIGGRLLDGRLLDTHLLPLNSIHFHQGNLFKALPPTLHSSLLTPHFSLIISNPPYIPSAQIKSLSPEVQNEPLLALDGGSDGLAIIRNIIAEAPDFLAPGGTLLLEADPGQMEIIASLLAERGFIDIKTYRDLSNQERVIGGIKKGA
ncbi:release factor glutamine methyltransferase [Spirochaetia bacterium]|nr:release factor glutamine methyltransferase [Spirochaetia bacterium]